MRQMILALGAAMVVGSIAVLVREWRRTSDEGPKPNKTVVVLNLVLGAVLTVWGAGSILAAR